MPMLLLFDQWGLVAVALAFTVVVIFIVRAGTARSVADQGQ